VSHELAASAVIPNRVLTFPSAHKPIPPHNKSVRQIHAVIDIDPRRNHDLDRPWFSRLSYHQGRA